MESGEPMINDRRKLTRSNLISFLLCTTIIITAFFQWTYFRRTSPIDTIKEIIPFEPVGPPVFLYAIGYEDDALAEPYDVAAADNGNLYVADTGHKVIKVFDINGKFLFGFGSRGRGPGQFLAPVNVAVAKDRVYVTDALTMKVQVFDLTGKFIGELITPEFKNKYGAVRPMGISVDGNNNLYITDIFYQRILKFNEQGQLLLSFGKSGNNKGQFYYPNDVSADKEGYIYVSDSNNSRVQVFDPAGKPFKVYDSKSKDLNVSLAITKGITFDDKGLFYIVDAAQNQIFVIKPAKNKPGLLFNIGGPGAKEPLTMPTGIASYRNKIIIADTGNNRLAVFGY